MAQRKGAELKTAKPRMGLMRLIRPGETVTHLEAHSKRGTQESQARRYGVSGVHQCALVCLLKVIPGGARASVVVLQLLPEVILCAAARAPP